MSRSTPPHPDTDSASVQPNVSSAIYLRARSGAARVWSRITPVMRKVPEITLLFWVIKVLTTAMGESTSDFLVFEINPVMRSSSGPSAWPSR